MRAVMKNHLLTLALVTFAATSTPTLAQAPASQTDKAVMPGSTTSPPPLTGGQPNPQEGHASTTCAKGPDAAERNATRPECANMGLPPPKGPATHKALPAGAANNNGTSQQ